MGLKLNLKKNQIHFTIKRRNKLWTKEFLIGLGLAAFFHLMGFTLFHIDLKGFLNPDVHSIALPVSSDLQNAAISFLDEEEKELEFPSYLHIPRVVFPLSSSITPKRPSDEITLTASIQSPMLLGGLELGPLLTSSQAEYHLSKGHAFVKAPKSLKASKICRAKLEFKAESKTGQIFWADFIESTQDKRLDYQIIEAIKEARILSSTRDFPSEGIIEVEFLS